MKKLFTFLSAIVMSLMFSSAYADEIVSYEPGDAYTTIAQLEAATGGFAIVNTTDGKAFYGSDAQNLAYDTYANAFKATNSGYKWKLESAGTDGYYLQLLTPAGENYNIWGNEGILNSQGEAQNWACSFILGGKGSEKRGQDIQNGGVYVLTYSADNKGWSIKNLGTGQYQSANTGPAHSDTPTYFTLCDLKSTTITNPIAKGTYDATDAKVFNEAGLQTSEVKLSWTEGIDLGKYQYIAITLGQNSMESSNAGIVSITDGNGLTIKGDSYGVAFQNMWFGSWNHQFTCGIDLEKLRTEQQFNIHDIRELSVGVGGDGVIINNIYASNVEAKTVNRWGSPNDEGTYRIIEGIKAGSMGTICLPYAASYAGVSIYEPVGKSNSNVVLRPIKGLMEAGKAYVYKVNTPLNPTSNDAKIYAFFYQAAKATVTDPVSTGALVGTFVESAIPESTLAIGAEGYFLPTSDKIAGNTAYLDLTKLSDVTPAEGDITIEYSNNIIKYVWSDNLIKNGDLADATDLSSFVMKGAEGVDVSMSLDSKTLTVKSGQKITNTYDSQLFFISKARLKEGDKFQLSFTAKADTGTKVEVQAHGLPDGNHYNHYQLLEEDFNVTTKYTKYVFTGTVTKAMEGADGLISIAFNLNVDASPNTYCFKNINLKKWIRDGETVEDEHIYTKDPAPEVEGLVKIGQLQDDSKDNLGEWAIDGTNTVYTLKANAISVAYKIKNVDVKDCDYVIIKFAEATPEGVKMSFWNGNDTKDLPSGVTEYKYVFAEDEKCAIVDDVLPQITALTIWNGTDKTLKVAGIYKHVAEKVSGDVNNDKVVDIADVAELVNVIISGETNSAADIDGNGNINIKDIETLVNTIIGSKE